MKYGYGALTAYYNENDPKAAEWLRQLIAEKLIAPGHVDERSIEDVPPADLAGFRQAHFFAGIGGWSYALRLAGWPDSRPVWTGSCPCQPFSQAGTGKGVDDERHLWPHWRWLLDQRRPPVVFGEQVASRDGRQWLAGVRSDLEAMGYEVGAADLCAASLGAPHIRQRLFWVADSERIRRHERSENSSWSKERTRPERTGSRPSDNSRSSGMANTDVNREKCKPGNDEKTKRFSEEQRQSKHGSPIFERSSTNRGGRYRTGESSGMADSGSQRIPPGIPEPSERETWQSEKPDHNSGRSNFWADSTWIPCADGKARRIKFGIEPLAVGISGRVGLLRGYGNAIVPQVAATFIEAVTNSNGGPGHMNAKEWNEKHQPGIEGN